MQGSIVKRGSTYYAVIALSHTKRKWYKGGDTRKAAQKVLREKLAELDSGTYRETPKSTFKEFVDHWLTTYGETNLKPSTLRGYKSILTVNMVGFHERKLTDITTGQLAAHVSNRLKGGASAMTMNHEVALIKLVFRHARRWGYLKISPADDLDRPKATSKEIEVLTPDEFRLFIEKVHPHFQTAFKTAFLCGLRAGELWALQWGDIDWQSSRLYVRRSVWKGRFQTPKTKKSIRKIDLPQQLVQELKVWKLACPVNQHDLVFPGLGGGIANHVNIANRHFYPALRRAGLRHVSFHSLRHSNASLRIQAGQNIKYVSDQLGHSTIKITLDVYGHLFDDVNFTRQQVEMLENSFDINNIQLEHAEVN